MHFVIRLVSGLIAQRHTALTRNIFNKSWVSTSRYESNSVCLSICWFINRTENLKFPNTGLVINKLKRLNVWKSDDKDVGCDGVDDDSYEGGGDDGGDKVCGYGGD